MRRSDPFSRGAALIHATLARRAAANGAEAARRQHVLAVLTDFASDDAGAVIGPVRDCEPMAGSRGGFFSCIAISETGGRHFVKCVPSRSREARFWRAWRNGAVATQGRYYRLLEPLAMRFGGVLTVLAFPKLPAAQRPRAARRRSFLRHRDRIVRALAEFNARHLAPGHGLPPSRHCQRQAVPRARTIRDALAVDTARAAEIVGALRLIEPKWSAVRRGLYTGPLCLGHLDCSSGNVAVDRRRVVLLDFGHAGTAPPGADLHTVLRYTGKHDGFARDRLVEVYAEVFDGMGVACDTSALRRAMDAHFAARYRNLDLRSARNRAVFAEALAVSLDLVGEHVPPGLTADRWDGPAASERVDLMPASAGGGASRAGS